LLLYEKEIANTEWGLGLGLVGGGNVGGLWGLEWGDDEHVSFRFTSGQFVSDSDDTEWLRERDNDEARSSSIG